MKQNKVFKALCVAALALGMAPALTGCLKQPYEVNFQDNTQRLITEFTDGKTGFANVALDVAPGTVTIDLTELRAVTRSKFNAPYTVKVAINNVLIGDYNTANQTNYVAAPLNAVQLVSNTLTISPDQRTATLRAQVNPNQLTGSPFAIGLTITEVSNGEISGDAKNIVLGILVKNVYDANYRTVGTQTHYGGPTTAAAVTIVHNIDKVQRFETIDAQRFLMETGQLSVTGAYHGVQVDPATNNCTIFPIPGLSFQITENNGPCTYNPNTKVFNLNYRYFNAAGNIRVIQQVCTRQ